MNTRPLRAIAAAVIVMFGCGGPTIGGPGAGTGGQGGNAGEPGTGEDTGVADDSGAAGDDGAGPSDGGLLDDVRPGEANCFQVRRCVAACKDDACLQACLDLGSPAGRALFDQLQTCSKTACPDQEDRTCRCEAECIFPGICAELQDMCADGAIDPACQMCA